MTQSHAIIKNCAMIKCCAMNRKSATIDSMT